MKGVFVLTALWLAGCQADAIAGDLCTRASDCPASLVCSRGRCRAACATSSDCPTLARCLVDPSTHVASCSLDVDSCATHPCPLGFLCVEDACLNACDAIVQCPDGVCASGACVPSRVDAGVPSSPDAGPSGPHVRAIVGGGTHFCAMGDSDAITGGLWCWGAATSFELGTGTDTDGTCVGCATTPQVAVDENGPLHDVTAIAAAQGFTCAVRNGALDCWGAVPQTTNLALTPHAIVLATTGAPLDDVRDAVAAIEHVCVRRGDTLQAWCFGANPDGRLGDATTTSRPGADQAPQINISSELHASWYHTLGLNGVGTIVGVGDDGDYALGVTATDPSTHGGTAPYSVTEPARVIATSSTVTCEVQRSDGRIACWGLVGPLVTAGEMPASCADGPCTLEPTMVAPPSGETIAGMVITQSQVPDAICLWTMSGGAWCLDTATMAFASVTGLSGVAEIAAGTNAMCARTAVGEVWCWGGNDVGQLGRGTRVADSIPRRVSWD